jgi:hypothetical protein
MRHVVSAMLAGAVLSVAPCAWADGVHKHDGFFLQMDLGLGGMGSEASQSGFDLKLSGTGVDFKLAIGGAPVENFILAGELWGVSVASPSATVNGSSATSNASSLGLSAFGVNFTYYFMPINIYVSAVPSIASLSVNAGGTTYSTKNGFAIKLVVGKEWWVSERWGLGLNAQYAHSSNEDSGTNPPTWATNWFGVAFSATYN